MQDCASSNKIKENKYKILRMSLLLGADDDRQETLNNFEDASRDIDAMNDEIYLKDIESKFYDTLKLEEEEKKLEVLVDYIGGRVEQRISLLSDFSNVTGYDLQGVPPIKYYDKLDDYKERLKYIREYLSNIEQINKLDLEIEESDTKLNEAYISKATSEEQNIKNEELLKNKFNNLVKNMDTFKEITEENIQEKLEEANYKVADSKKSLDIFTKSFTTLSGSGISVEEEQEYLSYVEGAEKAYYENKEEEYLLKIYNLLIEPTSDYNSLLIKREELNNILYERLNLRKNLKVTTPDILNNIYDLLEKQYEDLKRQSVNISKIETLNNEINLKKEQLNDLMNENQKVEILSLLREFCIIDPYEDETLSKDEVVIPEVSEDFNNIEIEEPKEEIPEEIELPPELEIDNELKIDTSDLSLENMPILESKNIITSEEEQENEIEEINEPEEIKDNQVINVENANNIDLDLIHSKASKVMKRVGDMLGIKTGETKLVTVSNEPETSSLETKEEPQVETPKEEPKEEIHEEVSKEENKDEITNEEQKEETTTNENPLFSDNLENTINLNIDPEFKNAISTMDETAQDNNNFWFPSDTPDALNELPDLEVPDNNNLFLNNNISDLQFPDLKIDFGTNDSEEK